MIKYQVDPGEEAKSVSVWDDLHQWLQSEKCTRDTVILALGGGVVGDLAGFVASTAYVFFLFLECWFSSSS